MEDMQAIVALIVLVLKIAMWVITIFGIAALIIALMYGIFPYHLMIIAITAMACKALSDWLAGWY